MMSIEHRNAGFSLKFSNPGSGVRGFRVQARNVAEVVEAVEHYYIHGTPHIQGREACPLCRENAKEGG